MANLKKDIKLDLEQMESLVPSKVRQVESTPPTPLQSNVRNPVGRPASKRTITRYNSCPMSCYLTNELKQTLDDASYFGKVDKADVIRTALETFFQDNVGSDGRLTEKGMALVQAYILKTTEG